jgi:hypothetical protein
MMSFKKSIVAIAITTLELISSIALAAEADNFTNRQEKLLSLPDSLEVLNTYTNQKIREAIARTNAEGTCSPRRLYLNSWDLLAHNPIGVIEKFAERSPLISSYRVDFKESIYGSIPTAIQQFKVPRFYDLFLMTGWFSGSIRVNGYVIGIDKIGHFFGQGWDYFTTGNLHDALNSGLKAEEGMDGFIGSGIYSYGDLSANYSGLHFWKQLLGGKKPYVSCRRGKYKLNRAFTFASYVNHSWDEALNCSKYRDPEMEKAVSGKIQSLGLGCPMEPKQCEQLVQAPCSNLTVSPACFEVTGVSIEQKAAECAEFEETQKWNDFEKAKLTNADKALILIDTLGGLVGMPWHYIKRK